MGLAKRLLEEIEARGASFIPGKYVCTTCLNDYALKAVVRENVAKWRCNYCGRRRRSAAVDDVMEVVMEGINVEYDDPANCMGWESREGGYQGVTFDTYDLVQELDITDDMTLLDDIGEAILNELWCEADPYGLAWDERLAYGWARFCERVKHENRFFPQLRPKKRTKYRDPDEVHPADLLKHLEDIFNELGLVRKLKTGTRVLRARSHEPGVVYRTGRELGPPPKEYATQPNRMSSEGVPMFYGAFDPKTALAEIEYPIAGRGFTVATFETVRSFNVVDLSDVPKLPSLFDLENAHQRPWIRFIREFVTDFSKPITRDKSEPVEYVPTQYVTAYIQHRMPGNIKGVLYPSSKVKGGQCCVLFFDNEECVEGGAGYPAPTQYLRILPTSIRRRVCAEVA